MKKITLTADEDLIKRAQAKARADKTTLTKAFRLWLTEYAAPLEVKEPSAQQRQADKTQGSLLTRSVKVLKQFEKKLEEKL